MNKNSTRTRLGCPIIIDIEASGFGAESYPIEVGVVFNHGRRHCSLILPAAEWTHWDSTAECIHGVSRETLEACGKPIREVATELNTLLAGKTVFSDGWVVDKPWLNTLFFKAGIAMQFHVSPLEMILTESQMNLWETTRDDILAETKIRRHRASNDAWVIQETYMRTLDAIHPDLRSPRLAEER